MESHGSVGGFPRGKQTKIHLPQGGLSDCPVPWIPCVLCQQGGIWVGFGYKFIFLESSTVLHATAVTYFSVASSPMAVATVERQGQSSSHLAGFCLSTVIAASQYGTTEKQLLLHCSNQEQLHR